MLLPLLIIQVAVLYMNYPSVENVHYQQVLCSDVSYVAGERVELSVHKETVVVEEIKEVKLRSRYAQFIYDANDDRIRLQRRGHAPSRLRVKKLRRLLHKKREVRAFVWKGICRQNTPVSSKIYCYIKCANSHFKRYKGKNVSLFQRGSNERVPKRGKVYLLSKYERRELQ